MTGGLGGWVAGGLTGWLVLVGWLAGCLVLLVLVGWLAGCWCWVLVGWV